jgi:3-oxoacyl-[acyl-carrier-protein] synthase-3
MNAYINFISYYLPSKILSNSDISLEHPEWSINKMSFKTGVYNRHISSDNEFVSDVAVKVAENLFREYKIIQTI